MMLSGNRQNFLYVRGAAEGVHHDDRFCAGGDGFFDPVRIQIQALRFDIDKYWRCSLVAHRICDGDKRKRRDNNFIAFTNPQCADAQVQPAGPRIHGDSMRGVDILRYAVLKLFQFWTQTQLRRAKYFRDGLNFLFADVRCREGNSHLEFAAPSLTASARRGMWRFIKSSSPSGTVVSISTIFFDANP